MSDPYDTSGGIGKKGPLRSRLLDNASPKAAPTVMKPVKKIGSQQSREYDPVTGRKRPA